MMRHVKPAAILGRYLDASDRRGRRCSRRSLISGKRPNRVLGTTWPGLTKVNL
jgi:hypothetical protein